MHTSPIIVNVVSTTVSTVIVIYLDELLIPLAIMNVSIVLMSIFFIRKCRLRSDSRLKQIADP